MSPVETRQGAVALEGRGGWRVIGEGKRKGLLFQLQGGSSRCPEPQSQVAVHLPHQDRSQREVNCGAQVPGSGPGAASSPPQIPPRTLQVRALQVHLTSLPLYASANSPGKGRVLARGPRAGVAEPEFKPIPALSSDSLSTYCVPGTQLRWGDS